MCGEFSPRSAYPPPFLPWRETMRLLSVVTAAACALRPPTSTAHSPAALRPLTRRQCTTAVIAAAAATALPYCANAQGSSLTDANGLYVVDPRKAANGLEDPLAESDGAYSTISAALAVAPSGATIVVRAGTYAERLTLPRSVRLLADAGAVLEWKSKGPNEPALTVDLSGATAACEVLVTGLTVRHASPYFSQNYAVYVPRPAAAADGGSLIELRGCEVSSSTVTAPAPANLEPNTLPSPSPSPR